MARFETKPLDVGDLFPDLKLKLINGEELQARKPTQHDWNVILFYRGSWCPFCQAQLKSFQSGLEKLADEGIGVVAASVDSLENAVATQHQTGAQFPLAYGLAVPETAQAIGAFYDENPLHTAPYLHSTNFVVDPHGKVVVSVYSSGAIGRLNWPDVLGLVKYLKANPQS